MSDGNGSGGRNSTGGMVTDAILIGALTGNNPLTNPLGLPQPGGNSSSTTPNPGGGYYPGSASTSSSVQVPRPPLTRAQKIRRTVLRRLGLGRSLAIWATTTIIFFGLSTASPLSKMRFCLLQSLGLPRLGRETGCRSQTKTSVTSSSARRAASTKLQIESLKPTYVLTKGTS